MDRRCKSLTMLAAAVAIATALPDCGAAAQGSRYRLTTTVTSTDGKPIAGAQVLIAQSGVELRSMRSDTAGRCVAPSMVARSFSMQIRRLGFEPKTMEVNVDPASAEASVTVSLVPSAEQLDPVSVVDIAGTDSHIRDFLARKASNNFGRYFDQRAIEERRPQYLSEMLRAVAGVALLPSSRIGYAVRVRGCAPLVWVDGVRLPGAQLDDVVQASDVAGLEVYNSFAGVPAQYFDRAASCGTILVWTRTK